jgi:hypothetical protein
MCSAGQMWISVYKRHDQVIGFVTSQHGCAPQAKQYTGYLASYSGDEYRGALRPASTIS